MRRKQRQPPRLPHNSSYSDVPMSTSVSLRPDIPVCDQTGIGPRLRRDWHCRRGPDRLSGGTSVPRARPRLAPTGAGGLNPGFWWYPATYGSGEGPGAGTGLAHKADVHGGGLVMGCQHPTLHAGQIQAHASERSIAWVPSWSLRGRKEGSIPGTLQIPAGPFSAPSFPQCAATRTIVSGGCA